MARRRSTSPTSRERPRRRRRATGGSRPARFDAFAYPPASHHSQARHGKVLIEEGGDAAEAAVEDHEPGQDEEDPRGEFDDAQVPLDAVERDQRLRYRRGGDEQRHGKPHRVDEEEERRRAVVLLRRFEDDQAEDRADARRPTRSESDPDQERRD